MIRYMNMEETLGFRVEWGVRLATTYVSSSALATCLKVIQLLDPRSPHGILVNSD